ncbi:hypothetical protein BOX15_Mlig027330g1, partial [Macrostomum lignano]
PSCSKAGSLYFTYWKLLKKQHLKEMYLELFNALTFSLGVILIATGYFLVGQKSQVYDLYGPTFPMALLIVISIGITIAAVVSDTSFYKSSSSAGSCQILIFILLIVLILSLELSAAVAGLALPDYIRSIASRNIQQQMANYPKANASASFADGREPWIDVVQRSFGCCGLNGSSDWLHHQGRPPASCCTTRVSQSTPLTGCNASSVHSAGCDYVIKAWLTGEVRVFAGIAAGICLLQLVSVGAMLYKKSTWRPKLLPNEVETKADFVDGTR